MQPPMEIPSNNPWLPQDLVKKHGRFLAAAMPWIRRGIAVIPGCPREKVPLVKFSAFHYLGAPPPDKQTISRWASQWPDANPLILVGQGGLVAVDVDDPNELEWCVNNFGTSGLITYSGRAPTADGKRACHLFYQSSEVVHGTNGLDGRKVDVKAHGGYVVGPGAIHPTTGREYTSSIPYMDLLADGVLEDVPRFSRDTYSKIWMGSRTLERKGRGTSSKTPRSATSMFEDGEDLPGDTPVKDGTGKMWTLGTVPVGVKFHAPGRDDGTPSATVWSPPDSDKRWCFDWSRSLKYYVSDVQCAFTAADLRKKPNSLRRSAAENAHSWAEGLPFDLPEEVSRLPATCLGHEEAVMSLLVGVGTSMGVDVQVEQLPAGAYISDVSEVAREGELTILVAPHGGGKSVWSAETLAARRDRRSVVVANTRALAVSAAKTYQSEVYLDSKGSIDSLHVSTTANSIMRITDTPESPVETLILDEADQCFDFMHSDRVDQPIAVFTRMMTWLGTVPCAIACSASMSPEHALMILTGAAHHGRKRVRFIVQGTTHGSLSINECDYAKWKVDFLEHVKRKAEGEIQEPLAVVVTAKKDAKVLSALVKKIDPNLKTWWCSSENSRLAKTRSELSDPDDILDSHDIVIATPALVSGISFTRPVYKVWCWDKNRKVDSDSVCQLVRRFRVVTTSSVQWGRPKWGKESIRYDDDYLNTTALGFAKATESQVTTKIPAITWDSESNATMYLDPLFAWSWRVAERRNRRSWANPVRCRYDSFRAYGWIMASRHAASDDNTKQASRAFNVKYEEAKEQRFNDHVEAVVNARPITEEEADTLRKAPEHEPGDHEALERYDIERFYGREADEGVVSDDKEGKLRKACRDLSRAMLCSEGEEPCVAYDDYRSSKGRHKAHYRHRLIKAQAAASLLSYVFQSKAWSDPIVGEFLILAPDIRERFRKIVEPHLTYYKEVLGIHFKPHAEEDRSVQTFNAFCRRLGFKISSSKVKDERVYKYEFETVKQYCVTELDRVRSSYATYKAEENWTKWLDKTQSILRQHQPNV